jgi:formylglycine-generating enzyme required for sulfatase activity
VTVGSGGGPAPAGFVEIPAGSFQMGDSFNEGEPNERPVHTVDVSRFYMQSTEVTNEQMAVVMNWAYGEGLVTASTSTVRNVIGNVQELLDMDGAIRLSWSGSQIVVDSGYEDHPVVEVTWYGAVAYCDFLTRKEGGSLTRCYDFADWSCDFTSSGYRLPTEAEWEKAARLAAANAGETWRYPFGNSIDSTKANYEPWPDDIHDATKDVASYAATAGLYDMAGNVLEWCHDWESSGYYSSSPGTSP